MENVLYDSWILSYNSLKVLGMWFPQNNQLPGFKNNGIFFSWETSWHAVELQSNYL